MIKLLIESISKLFLYKFDSNILMFIIKMSPRNGPIRAVVKSCLAYRRVYHRVKRLCKLTCTILVYQSNYSF